MTENPSSLYKYIKSCRTSGNASIHKLTVGKQVYVEEEVPDGFYESMTSLKSCNIEELKYDPALVDQFSNHEHILKLCQDHHKIPKMSRSRLLICCQE